MPTATQLENRIDSIEAFRAIVGKFIQRLGDPAKFEFRGEVIDLGTYGKGKCTCDHPVRYMLLIWGPNGEVAPVGTECIKHFAAYNTDLFNKLEAASNSLTELLAKENRDRAEALRLSKKDGLAPAYALAKAKLIAVCKLHQERISTFLPRALWEARATVLKGVPEYKTTNGYIKFYEKTILDIETTLGKYEQGELK